MKKIWLDCETYSTVNIKKHGMFRYARRAEPLIITYAFDDEPVKVWELGQDKPHDLIEAINQGVPVYAHNALFDYLILKDHYQLSLEQMRDTMAISAANNLPLNLDDWGKLLEIENPKIKGEGTRLINLFCSPDKKLKRRITAEDYPDKWQRFIDYAVRDVEAMREATKRCRELSESEYKTWLMTQRMNLKGVPVNLDSANIVITIGEAVKAELKDEMKELIGISPTQTGELLKALQNSGLDIKSVDKETLTNLNRDELTDIQKKLIDIRLQASMTSVKKFLVFVDTADIDSRIKGGFTYHGASTGRYSSKGGLNLQNIPRGSEKDQIGAYNFITSCSPEEYQIFYGNRIDPLSSIIRPTIEAPNGKKFVVYDYSSIENRVAPFIAGEEDHLELFRQGIDEYKDFASEVFSVPYDKVTKDQRQFAKPAVLGSVFGAGAKGVRKYFEGYGFEISETRAKQIVNIYRNKHERIQEAWYEFEKVVRRATSRRKKAFTAPKTRVFADKEFLRLELPSKRVLSWFQPRGSKVTTPWGEEKDGVSVNMKNSYKNGKYEHQVLIGSSVFQSVVQATARDILVEAMKNLEKMGYDVIMTVHDEVVIEVPDDWDNTAEIEQIMTTAPEWAKEIPLEVEGYISKNYKK